jgi:xylose dehydrogenase (NAD/NADP)
MTRETQKIRWGVLGCARIARELVIPAIVQSNNSTFHSIASRDPAKLAECRTKFNTAKTYSSYDELLRDDEVDAVYIPLPNSMHREWTIKCAERGKHILCEKPIALNAAECREMISACAANRVTLMEAFMYRYTDRTRKVLEVLRSSALGEIQFISSTFRFLLTNPSSIKLKPELGGGSLYDVGCYPVNFIGMVADHISGSTEKTPLPESVSVELNRTGGVDMMFSALMKYPSGLIAAVNSGFNLQRRILSEIVGTKGALEIPDTFIDSASPLTLITGDDRQQIPVELNNRYVLEIEDFADAIRQKRNPLFSLAETQRNMEVLDKLFAACKS